MAINYTQAFNVGEVSRKVDGLSNLDVYKIGCRDLDNFYVLPQGGVERRAGTEFVQLAGSGNTPDGTNPARMIEFDFSSDIRFVIELGTNYAKVHYTDDSGVDQVVNVTPTDNINYTTAELRQIQFTRRYDTLILNCPTKETMIFTRDTVTPTFSIKNIEFVYPPTMEKNVSTVAIDPSLPSPNIYTGTTNLVASNGAIFYEGHVNSNWAIDYIRATNKKEITFEDSGGTSQTFSDPLDVSFSNWEFSTDGTWKGALTLQRSIAGSSFDDYIIIGNTTGGVSRNFAQASDTPEGANTRIRIAYTRSTGSDFASSLSTGNIYHKGLVKITSVTGSGTAITAAALSSNVVTITATSHGLSTGDYVIISGLGFTTTNPDIETQITVTDVNTFTYALNGANETFTTSALSKIAATNKAAATVVSMLQGGNFDSGGTAQDPDSTIHWSEGSFSTYRGFCPATEFFENRLWMAGAKDQPADLFASVFNNIFNFNTGTLSTDAIKRTVDSPEEPKWLQGKQHLFLGTAGSAVSIRSADRDALITQTNITTLVENSYGSAALQAEIANDVVVYVQRDGLRLRELVYDRVQDTYVGNDLNFLSEDITESGIVEMFVQKEPNQFIWCIKENGTACILTYERGLEVKAWARIETDGKFYSASAIHDSGEDIVWACIDRGTTSSPKYCIEKFHPRKDLDWYVDSGKRLEGGAAQNANSVNLGTGSSFGTLEIVKTGLGDNISGKVIKISNTNDPLLDGRFFKGTGQDPDTITLQDLNGNNFTYDTNTLTISGITGANSGANGSYQFTNEISNGKKVYENSTDSSIQIRFTGSAWDLRAFFFGESTLISSSSDLNDIHAPTTGWSNSVILNYNFAAPSVLTFEFVYNEITGLNHLEGKTVQVVGDGSFIEEATVSSNKITTNNYYNTLLAGLPYTSTLSPMPIEPTLVAKLSQGRVKAISKIIVRFFNTKGAKVGEVGRQLTTFPVADTQDPSGQPISLKTGQQRFFVGSDYEREKLIEVRQDLPYPMTVLSIASEVNAEGI